MGKATGVYMKNENLIVNAGFFHKSFCKYHLVCNQCDNKDYRLSAGDDCFYACDVKSVFFKNKKLHRLDGPAIEYSDGSYVWCKDGRLHREDGPAYHYNSKSGDELNEWWYNGVSINCGNTKEFINWIKYRVFI